jgi:hypothetical protein
MAVVLQLQVWKQRSTKLHCKCWQLAADLLPVSHREGEGGQLRRRFLWVLGRRRRRRRRRGCDM